MSGCRDAGRSDSGAGSAPLNRSEASADTALAAGESLVAFLDQVRPSVTAFCGDCHAMPRPESSPSGEWPEEVNQGFMLYGQSGRTDLTIPPYGDVLDFFQKQAPTRLEMPSSIKNYPPSSIPFDRREVHAQGRRSPAITNVQWIDLEIGDSPALIYTDIATGMVKAHWRESVHRIATLLQPVHCEPCDLNDDGLIDLVVADIGEFNANDTDIGRVVWLRQRPAEELESPELESPEPNLADRFESIVLLDGLSRVADVRTGDFDQDGDDDCLVAVFGWRKSGEILLLVNQGLGDDDRPQFEVQAIDDRSGPVHVPTIDLNGDGHLDFIALISQEHEIVEAFLNDGTGHFEKQTIWEAPDPAYGSSGIELVDMDNDGDSDILYTNGDSFDRGVKPHHGVQWLENTGTYPYTHHHVGWMPGVQNARPGDFDNDGDIDIIAGSLVVGPADLVLREPQFSSLVLFEQTAPNQWKPQQMEHGNHRHLSLAAGDFDGDGRLDLAAGNFMRDENPDNPDLIIWSPRPPQIDR